MTQTQGFLALGRIGLHTVMTDLSLLEQDVATLIVQTLKLKIDPSMIQPEAALFGDGSASRRRRLFNVLGSRLCRQIAQPDVVAHAGVIMYGLLK